MGPSVSRAAGKNLWVQLSTVHLFVVNAVHEVHKSYIQEISFNMKKTIKR